MSIWVLVGFLAASALSMVGFIVGDAYNAFDNNPLTPTLSSKIKAWKRISSRHKAFLVVTIVDLAFIPIFLYLHLVKEVI